MLTFKTSKLDSKTVRTNVQGVPIITPENLKIGKAVKRYIRGNQDKNLVKITLVKDADVKSWSQENTSSNQSTNTIVF